MRKIIFTLVLPVLCGLLAGNAVAATFTLGDGRTLTGDLVVAGSDDASALIKTGDGKYDRVPWGQFSQEDLKSFLAQYKDNKKIVEAAEPFLEVTQEERAKKTDVKIKPVDPVVEAMQKEYQQPKSSVIGSLFKSGVGLFLVLLVYGANIFAGYEISIFRAHSMPLVVGLAAIPILGFVSNIVFLALPTRPQKRSEADLAYEEQHAGPTPTIAIPGHEAAAQEAAQAAYAAQAEPAAPKAEVFARGQFTFNKRFFETKFPNFFGVVRREEDKHKVLIFKTSKGEFIVQRITRITPGEIFIQADRGGGASVETPIHFGEIQEITLKQHA